MKPSLARFVIYKLSQHDVDKINPRRVEDSSTGNIVHEGDPFPAVVVRTFGGSTVNLQVFLDGPDTLWVTSRIEGNENGQWSWPNRV